MGVIQESKYPISTTIPENNPVKYNGMEFESKKYTFAMLNFKNKRFANVSIKFLGVRKFSHTKIERSFN